MKRLVREWRYWWAALFTPPGHCRECGERKTWWRDGVTVCRKCDLL